MATRKNMRGVLMETAARASWPRIRPTKMPSIMLYAAWNRLPAIIGRENDISSLKTCPSERSLMAFHPLRRPARYDAMRHYLLPAFTKQEFYCSRAGFN